jgi:subtilisin family serine protease
MGLRAPSKRLSPVRPLALVAAAAAAALLVGAAPPASGGTEHSPGVLGGSWTSAVLDSSLPITGADLQRVVVSGVSGAMGAVREAVESVGGTADRALPIIDGVSATVPADRLVELARKPGVSAITKDRQAKLYATSWDESLTASSYVWNSGATAAWAAGARGTGVGVAVLDTGISTGNDHAGRVVHGPDLSGEGRHNVDTFGHGTVMGGIVGGSGVDGGATPRTGIAPGAHLVSVKLAGANGATDVSTVLAGMHWVAAFKDTYNIRVMNLSWGVPSTQHSSVDPLNHAVQRLWGLGITVVVAAGNNGPHLSTITKPADDPLVITVGAYDERGDQNASNDIVPQWSSQGPTAEGLVKPDLAAPGRTLIATRAPGSTVEASYPKALIAPSYVKGSGTSQAAAVVSGAAALLLSARPELTPDQVKAALRQTANPIPNVLATSQGAGRIQIDKALAADVSAVVSAVSTATGTGTLEGSRGSSARVLVTCEGVERLLTDETTSWCTPWSGNAWTGNAWTGNAWTGNAWTGNAWTGNAWTGNAWTGAGWSSDGWSGNAWTGTAWTGNAWTGMGWSGNAWTGDGWTSAEYEEADPNFLSAFWGPHPKPGRSLPGELNEDEVAASIAAPEGNGPPAPFPGASAADVAGGAHGHPDSGNSAANPPMTDVLESAVRACSRSTGCQR